ncbi:MAG: primase [Bacteriovoracaceae bacterium]|nr:primase [Bacteriovoracaceae bacterium]
MKNSQVIDSIRQAVDIVQIINEVVPLKKSGSNFFGVCPFHNEKSASLSVSGTKQLFHCFGCKVGGDVFKFLQLFHRWDFPQTLEELAKRSGIKLESYNADPTWEEGFQILDLASTIFEEALHSKEGQLFRYYLESRKIPEKIWKDFRLGAHLGHHRFFAEILEKKGFHMDIAVRLGLLGRSSNGEFVDRFQGRLMFPILDEKGRTRGFGGRTLGSDQPKYINSPKTAHFDKSRLFYGTHLASKDIPRKGYTVLVEGYLDVISLHEFGVSNALGSMGTSLTMEQIRILKRMSARVISLYDADRAGLAATEKNLGNFLREGLESKVVVLPNAKDPDAFLHDETMSVDERKNLLRKSFESSVSALDYLIKNTVLSESNAQVRGQRLRGLVSILDHVPDEIERAVLKKDLAKRFELPESMLFSKTSPEKDLPRFAPNLAPAPTITGDTDRWEREILRFLVKWGEKGDFALTGLISYLSSTSKWTSLLLRLTELQLESKAIAHLQWLTDVDVEVQSTIREWAMEEKIEEKSDFAAMDFGTLWADLQKGLRRSYFQKENERIQRDLVAAEEQSDIDRVRGLLSEKQDLLKMFKSVSESHVSANAEN